MEMSSNIRLLSGGFLLSNAKRPPRVLAVLSVFFASLQIISCAGVGDRIQAVIERKMTHSVRVVDETGAPVVGASVWILRNGKERSDLDEALMSRLLQRHASEADYIDLDFALHPALSVHYTDADGRFSEELGENDFGDEKEVVTIAAAIKRGFGYTLKSGKSRTEGSHELVLTLKRRAREIVNPKLLRLDELRGQAQTARKMTMMSDSRYKLLERVKQELMAIATSLEVDGEQDAAARVYFYLSAVPTVDRYFDVNGNQIGQGFSNGYHDKDAWRKSAREKAMALNRTSMDVALRRAFWAVPVSEKNERIRVLDKYFDRHGDRLWPGTYHTYAWNLLNAGWVKKACSVFQSAYNVEPKYLSAREWRDEENRINKAASRHAQEGFLCRIANDG